MIGLLSRGVLPLTLLVGGCDLGPDYQRPEVEMPVQFRATEASGTEAWPSEDWWRGFRSRELTALIEQARAQNFDIAAAIARVRQADAQVRIAGSALLPNVAATASASWQQTGATRGFTGVSRGGSTNSTIDIRDYSLTPLNVAYEVDFWGKNRAARQSAMSSAMFSRFDQQVVALTVVTNVANTWFTALALADRLVVAQRNLADAEQTLAVIRGRLDAGTANALDVAQQESLVAGERATIPNLRNQLEQALIGLGILVGRPPEAITVRPGSLNNLALPPVAPGLPSALLQRRPDVAEAEALLVAANFDIKVARAAFFPSIQLTGSYGFSNAALNTLFTPGGTIDLDRRRIDPAAVRRRRAARAARTGQRALRRAAGRLSQGGGAGVHRCRGRPDRVALHHRTGGAAATGSGNGAAGSQYRHGHRCRPARSM